MKRREGVGGYTERRERRVYNLLSENLWRGLSVCRLTPTRLSAWV